jgi:ABC-type uncharacterized transport system substrate-binding protein
MWSWFEDIVIDGRLLVFTWVSDPVGSGFVKNLPHPGGNITGFHNFEPTIGGKWTWI